VEAGLWSGRALRAGGGLALAVQQGELLPVLLLVEEHAGGVVAAARLLAAVFQRREQVRRSVRRILLLDAWVGEEEVPAEADGRVVRSEAAPPHVDGPLRPAVLLLERLEHHLPGRKEPNRAKDACDEGGHQRDEVEGGQNQHDVLVLLDLAAPRRAEANLEEASAERRAAAEHM